MAGSGGLLSRRPTGRDSTPVTVRPACVCQACSSPSGLPVRVGPARLRQACSSPSDALAGHVSGARVGPAAKVLMTYCCPGAEGPLHSSATRGGKLTRMDSTTSGKLPAVVLKLVHPKSTD